MDNSSVLQIGTTINIKRTDGKWFRTIKNFFFLASQNNY